MDYGAETHGGNGRPVRRHHPAGNHSHARTNGHRLENPPASCSGLHLLGSGGSTGNPPAHTAHRYHPPLLPLPEDADKRYRCTPAQASRRAFLFLPLDIYLSG